MTKKGVGVFPFRGYRFRGEGLIQDRVAPPYDVFDYNDSMHQRLKTSPYNIVHVQKPEGQGDTKYYRARQVFAEWLEQEVVGRDDSPSYYIYEQETSLGVRRGIIAAVEIDDTYQFVRRHEHIKSGPKIDRLKLTLATGLNIGLIFSVFKDPRRRIAQRMEELVNQNQPIYDFVWPPQGARDQARHFIRNKLYQVVDGTLENMLQQMVLYIADGHHRYQTMIDYQNRMSSLYGVDGEWNRTMMFVAPDNNLIVLGYHRVIKNISAEQIEAFWARLAERFRIKEKQKGEILAPRRKHEIGVYGGGVGYLIEIDGIEKLLDSEYLQEQILEPYLGIGSELLKDGHYVSYPNGEDSLTNIAAMVDEGEHQIAFLLYPTTVEDLMRVADNNQILPQKSTYFFPKLLTGLVFNKVGEAQDDLSVE